MSAPVKRLPDSTSVDLLDLSVGTANCLQMCGVKTLGDARRLTLAEWTRKLAPNRGGDRDRGNLIRDLWEQGVRLRPVVAQFAWAIEDSNRRGSHIFPTTVRSTRSQAWVAAREHFTGGLAPGARTYPQFLAMFKAHRRRGLIRAVRVQIEWAVSR